eukprot:Gb_17055 [translate_table: standard]
MGEDEKIPVSWANESQQSQSKDKKRSEVKMVVNKLFVNDKINNNHLLSIHPEEEATRFAISWDSTEISSVSPNLSSYVVVQIVPNSPVGLKEDTMSSKVVDTKKDDLKVVSCDSQSVLIMRTMAIDIRGNTEMDKKRANVDEVESLEEVDPHLVMSMKRLQQAQDELDKANEEASDKVLEIE